MLSFEQIKKLVISKVGYANPGMIRDEAISYLNELVKDKHDLVLCVKTETITKNGKTYLDEKIYNNIINKYEQSNKKITRAEFLRKRVGIGAANEIMEYLHPRCYNCKKFIMIPTKVYFANLYLGGYQLGNRIEEFVKKIINSKEGYTRIKIDYSYDKTYFVIESNYYNYDKIQISFTYRFYTKMLDEIIPKLTTNITCSKDCCYEMRKKCNEINLNERFKALLQPNLTKKLKL